MVPGKPHLRSHLLQMAAKSIRINQTQQVHFAEITPQPQPGGNIAVTVRVAGAEAEIYSGADAQTVELVLRVLKSC